LWVRSSVVHFCAGLCRTRGVRSIWFTERLSAQAWLIKSLPLKGIPTFIFFIKAEGVPLKGIPTFIFFIKAEGVPLKGIPTFIFFIKAEGDFRRRVIPSTRHFLRASLHQQI